MCKSKSRPAPQPKPVAPAAPPPAPNAPVAAPGPEGKEMSEQARAEAARKKGRAALRIDLSVGGVGGGSGLNVPQG